ncbi:MAG: NAD(P)H-dependent amine dehydrogenase family protein [Terriglobales bacterium]
MKKIRVIQYGVGPIGAGMVRLMLEKPEIQIVGAIDVDPAKAGKDLGTVAGAKREIGLKISADSQAVLRAGADVVVHTTSSYLTSVAGQLTECLEAGLHVVSTCEELSYPFRKHPELSRKLDETASKHNVVLLGTGVNPGFVLDKLILTLATACQKVTHASGHRVVNASTRRQPLQAKIGSGMTVEEFQAKVKAGVIKHHGLPESVGMVADGLGLEVAKIEEVIEPVLAQERVKTDYFDVPAGKVVGVRQVARGTSAAGKINVDLTLEMYLGAPDSMDTVSITGTPELTLTVPGGTHGDLATAAITVNCIPVLFEMRPGLRTSKDTPMRYFPGSQPSIH